MLQASTSDPISALLQQVINNFASMGDTKQSLFNFAYDDGSRGYGELQLHLTDLARKSTAFHHFFCLRRRLQHAPQYCHSPIHG